MTAPSSSVSWEGRRERFGVVVVRCPFGLPAVTEQSPYDRSGEPFPTTYYLTCPRLVAAVSRVESAGGVERWSRALEEDDELADSLARATDEQRRLRHELAAGSVGSDGGASLELGIAGSRAPRHLKCLHAHAAFALARPGYLVGERILAEVWTRVAGGPVLLGRAPGAELPSAFVTPDVESARHEWEDAYRRLELAASDAAEAERLRVQLEVVTNELRRRLGSTFTLGELAGEYRNADDWARHAVSERAGTPGWPTTLTVVEGAAFHLYARGAVDYVP